MRGCVLTACLKVRVINEWVMIVWVVIWCYEMVCYDRDGMKECTMVERVCYE